MFVIFLNIKLFFIFLSSNIKVKKLSKDLRKLLFVLILMVVFYYSLSQCIKGCWLTCVIIALNYLIIFILFLYIKYIYTKKELTFKKKELAFLNSQVHPHFLFNSLNIIYGFAILKSDEAPEMILKLSNLLDYILHQIEKPKVSLIEEIKHLEDYISLEKKRFNNTLKVSFKKDLFNKYLQIPPMLLIPFVENSFKHGVVIDGSLHIDIKLKTKENKLFFQIENSSTKKKAKIFGIGIQNIKKRLEILYPEKHQLIIVQDINVFKVNLKLEF